MPGGATSARTALIVGAVLVASGCGTSARSPSVATGATSPGTPPRAVRAVDPCTLLTDAEIRALLTEPGSRPLSGGESRSSCRVGGASNRLSLQVWIFGDPETAPAVYSQQLTSAAEPRKVLGVGRAAFAVVRPDEVGVVAMTERAVLSVSLVAEEGALSSPAEVLGRLTPVVRQASARL